MMKSWEAQDWIVAIDARLSSPQQEISRVSVPVGGSANEHEVIPDQSTYDLEQFEKDYLKYVGTTYAPGTKDNAERVFKALKGFLGNKNLCDFTALDIENFKAKRSETVAKATVNIDVRTLITAFNRAVDWGKISKNPFSKVKQIKIADQKKRHITDDEFIKIFDAVEDAWMKDVAGFAYLTGLRLGEVMNLRWVDYDETNKRITVHSTVQNRVKGGKMRVVSLPDDAVTILAKRSKGSDWVFTNEKGRHLTNDYGSRLFKNAVRTAGLSEDIHFHSLRHSFGTKAAEARIPIHVIQKIMGHSSSKTTEGYIGDNQEFTAAEMQKITIPKTEAKKDETGGSNAEAL
jgi:integrase